MFVRLYPSEKLLYIPIEDRHIESIVSRFRKTRSTTHTATSKMALSRKSLAGPGYIILNIIRVMNVIGLLAVIAASVVMLVKTSVASKFFFFDAVSHVLTAVTGIFLLASEVPTFNFMKNYFARNWPLLSPSHGFVTLALAMQVLGINMLGNLNKPATSKKSLGLSFWRIVIASGIVIFILGWINLIASYVFRNRAASITARQVRADGAVAEHKSPKSTGSVHSSTPSAPELAQTYIHQEMTSPTKNRNPFGFMTSDRRNSILPSYHASSPSPVAASPPYPTNRDPVSPTSRYSRATDCPKKSGNWFTRARDSVIPPMPRKASTTEPEISGPLNRNAQFDGYPMRPDSTMHPARTGESETRRWKA